MRNLLTVAKYTFIEGLRARFFIGALLVSLGFVLLGATLAATPYGKVDLLIGRIGWGAIFLTGFLLSVFYAIQVISRERDQRLLLLMLSKPVGRPWYALGKYLGLLALLAVTIFVEGAVLMGTLSYLGEAQHDYLVEWFVPGAFTVLKCAVLLGFAVWFATVFVTPTVAMLMTGTLYLVGIGSHDLLRWARSSGSEAMIEVARVLEWVAPQFSELDVEAWIIYGVDMTPEAYLTVIGYYLGYLAIALVMYVLATSWMELQ